MWCNTIRPSGFVLATLTTVTTLAALAAAPASSHAQRMSVGAGMDFLSYAGSGLQDRDGSRAGHLAVRYAVSDHALLGVGASIGSFDVKGHGSSFTAYTIFLEPAVMLGTGRYRTYVGPRIGWEHERLGSSVSHVGGSFGGAAGVLFTLHERWTAGMRTQLDFLRLGAWRANNEPSLRGKRWQIGAELRWVNSRSATSASGAPR